MRHHIIGDVHGCIDELEELVSLLDPTPQDGVVLVGDVVDRGPASAEVLRFLRELSTRTNVTLVRGNHENTHLRGNLAGDEDAQRVAQQLTPDDMEMLRATSIWQRLPEYGVLVVHGGIPANMLVLPDTLEDVGALESRDRKRIAQLMYTVNIMVDGKPYAWPWRYDGRFGHVIFGHRANMTDRPIEYPHATGIDLGCVYGNLLCGITLEGRVWRSTTVKARRQYAELRPEGAWRATG